MSIEDPPLASRLGEPLSQRFEVVDDGSSDRSEGDRRSSPDNRGTDDLSELRDLWLEAWSINLGNVRLPSVLTVTDPISVVRSIVPIDD